MAIPLITLMLTNSLVYAQTPNFLWTVQAGGTNLNSGNAIAVDKLGNSIITGHFFGIATFGTISLASAGLQDIFIAKYDASGNVLWAKQAGGADSDAGLGISVDQSGNSIVTGYFTGTATFDTITLISAGGPFDPDIFIAKYDASGNVLWAKRAGGTNSDIGVGVATDRLDNSILTGYFFGTVAFDTITLTSTGENDIFIAKYDGSGNILWAKQAGGEGFDEGHDVATDGRNNSIITGRFQGIATFGPIALTSAGRNDIFIAKYDASGNVLWAKQAGGGFSDNGDAIATDQSGNSIITGYFFGAATFDTITLISAGSNDIFIAKYDGSGNILWAKQAGGTRGDFGIGISVDESGSSLVTGQFQHKATFDTITLDNVNRGFNDIFIAKYDALGNVVWAKQAGGMGDDVGNAVAVDESGNSIVTGYFTGTATFGRNELISAGGVLDFDIFIAKLSASTSVSQSR